MTGLEPASTSSTGWRLDHFAFMQHASRWPPRLRSRTRARRAADPSSSPTFIPRAGLVARATSRSRA